MEKTNNRIKTMKKALIFILTFWLSVNSYATTNAASGQKWYGPFTITKVANYWDTGYRTTVHVSETPTTNCSVTNNQKAASYHINGGNFQHAQLLYSILATAQAQKAKVNILLDSGCDSTYGLNLHGVEIISN